MTPDWISAFANIVLALAAVAALCVAKKQINVGRQIAATQMSGDVLKIEIDHPNVTDANGLHPQYEAYMGFMLTAYEQILTSMIPNREYFGWRNSVKDNLRFHRKYFIGDGGLFDRDEWLKFYEVALVDIFQEIVEEPKLDA